jgi:hypothetical protein
MQYLQEQTAQFTLLVKLVLKMGGATVFMLMDM